MDKRRDRMNEFLIYFRDIAYQNPDCELSYKEVYDKLTKLGVKEIGKRINDKFKSWLSFFENDENVEVKVANDWTYFCQFISRDKRAEEEDEHLKVYIPLDSSHVEQGAIDIFKFLSDEKISHKSKIGSHVRFDNVVIRLIDPKDLVKLLNFVKENKNIQEGLIPANPFAFNANGLALAVDGSVSYNLTVASLIKRYINECKHKNTLDKVNVDDFSGFIHNYLEKAFTSSDGIRMLNEDFCYEDEDEITLSSSEIVNYKNVIELILKTMNKNFTFDDYVEHYEKCSNYQEQHMKIAKVDDMLEQMEKEDKVKNSHEDEKRVIRNVHEILTIMGNKYGKVVAIKNLEEYVKTGGPMCLTRSGNLRERIVNSTFREDIRKLIVKRNIKLSKYLDIVSDVTIGVDETYLIQALSETYDKYEGIYRDGLSLYDGKAFIRDSIKQLIKDGKYCGFTRDNNARKNLEDNVSVSDARKIVAQKMGIDYKRELSFKEIDNAVENYVDMFLSNNQTKSKSM